MENNAELLEEGYNENINELEEFALQNGFCGAFRTSSKTGFNVNESMEFLINNIIERIEKKQQPEKKGFFQKLFGKWLYVNISMHNYKDIYNYN